jgi:hypothetical protein
MVHLTTFSVVQVTQRRLDSCSQDSLVGLTTLRAECLMNRRSNPGRGKRFMSSPMRPERHWDPPNRRRAAGHLPHLAAKLRKGGARPQLPVS